MAETQTSSGRTGDRPKPQRYPTNPADYGPFRDPQAPATTDLKASDIPLGHTTAGATEWAPLVMAGCTEPLPEGAPDLRGVWEAYEGAVGHVERIEQAGNRLNVTVVGLIHDMFCDFTIENGVQDFGQGGGIKVAARYHEGRHDLHPSIGTLLRIGILKEVPEGLTEDDPAPTPVVSRWREGDDMIWLYNGVKSRLRRLTAPPTDA